MGFMNQAQVTQYESWQSQKKLTHTHRRHIVTSLFTWLSRVRRTSTGYFLCSLLSANVFSYYNDWAIKDVWQTALWCVSFQGRALMWSDHLFPKLQNYLSKGTENIKCAKLYSSVRVMSVKELTIIIGYSFFKGFSETPSRNYKIMWWEIIRPWTINQCNQKLSI